MKILDKEQRRTLRKIFTSNLTRIGSLPFNLHGTVMSEFDRSLSEMDRLIGSSPATRGIARKCSGCRVPTRRGVYSDGMKYWLCLECAERRREAVERRKQRTEQKLLQEMDGDSLQGPDP